MLKTKQHITNMFDLVFPKCVEQLMECLPCLLSHPGSRGPWESSECGFRLCSWYCYGEAWPYRSVV